MSKPTEHTFPVMVTGPTRVRKKRLVTHSPFGAGSAPPIDSPLQVWTGSEWVSTGVSVVAP